MAYNDKLSCRAEAGSLNQIFRERRPLKLSATRSAPAPCYMAISSFTVFSDIKANPCFSEEKKELHKFQA